MSQSLDTPNPALPESFPWGVAVVSVEDGGRILYANAPMKRYYLGDNPESSALEDFLTFPAGENWDEVALKVSGGMSWMGRVVPNGNQHGIASVELMLQPDPANRRRAWVYTLEHPAVDGSLRFSSRSELQILQVLLENTLEYVFFRDREGRFIITNSAFSRAVSEEPEFSPTGRTMEQFASPESAKWVREIDKAVLETGTPAVNKVALFVFHGGAKHWLQMSTVPVRNATGEIVGSVSVARDISDLKRTEFDLRRAIREAREASRAKGEFLAAMSHEIRTPINGIIGASELCRELELTPEQKSYLDTVIQCGDTLLNLVNDVLDFSKIEAGKLELEKVPFDARRLVEEVADEFTQTLRKNELELIVAYDESLPGRVSGDPTRLKQILYNLVGNAVKFTGEGGVILVRSEELKCEEDRCRIRFSVTDTGVGIAPDRREAIFQSFTQEDMSTTRQFGGSGLGLAICKDLVDLMGGRIRVESEVGKGSEFIVEIPFERVSGEKSERLPVPGQLRNRRVLIVDDQPMNRAVYAKMCDEWGLRHSESAGGMDALESMETAFSRGDPYQLVLLDQEMPSLRGLDILRLMGERPELEETKVIVLFSSLDREEMLEAEKLGVARCLSKPLKQATLRKAVWESLDAEQRVPDAGPVEAPELVADGTAGETGPALRLLVAEDNKVNQRVAQRRLEKFGHAVTIVEDGEAVLGELEQREFDCVFMDVQMPKVDGLEATRRIRRLEQEKGRRQTFIVAMTAYAMKSDAERCFTAGMNDYVAKPVRKTRLEAVLNEAIRRRKGYEASEDEDGRVEEAAGNGSSSWVPAAPSLSAIDFEDIEHLSEEFIDEVPKKLRELDHAIASGDAESVRFMVHGLKNLAAVFPDHAAMDLAQRIEDECAKEPPDFRKIRGHADDLSKRLDLLVDAIQHLSSNS